MPEMREASIGNMDATQAAELSLLVDLEARWENLRRTPLQPREVESSTQDLQGKQKAYESFHTKLVAYNKQYTPAHVPEMLLNTPSRLARWCRTMRNLYLRVEHDPRDSPQLLPATRVDLHRRRRTRCHPAPDEVRPEPGGTLVSLSCRC
jgi:hypothetical protein